tara:strand:+ start:261 stop:1475 length:1215 start_codon:yes stop_codon:yes gene_type:complete
MSVSTTTNARTGTTTAVYTVASVQELVIDDEKLPTLTDEMKVIAEGLARKQSGDEWTEETGAQMFRYIQEFCFLADLKWKKNTKNGKPKGKSKEEKDALKALRAEFDSSIEDNKQNQFIEDAEGWARVDGNYGEIYFDTPLLESGSGGKKKVPYFYSFDEAVAKSEELGSESITKTKYGYSLRTTTIPIKVGTKKGSDTLSHPERSIASWVKLSEYPLKHSRTEAVKDRRVAQKFELENKTQECIFMAEKLRKSESPKSEVPVVPEKTELQLEVEVEKYSEKLEKFCENPTEETKAELKEQGKKTDALEEALKAKKIKSDMAKLKKASAARKEAARKKAEEEAARKKEEQPDPESDSDSDGEIEVSEIVFEGTTYFKDDASDDVYNDDQECIGTWDEENQRVVF